MFYILTTLYFLLTNAFFVYVFKKTFAKCLPLTFITTGIILYIFGFINNLKLGYYFCWVLSITFLLLILKDLIFKNKDKLLKFKLNYFKSSLLIYIIFQILIFLFYRYQGFSNCDEYTHWGPMVKSMFEYNRFYVHTGNILIFHPDYPPFISLIELFFTYLNNSPTQSSMYVALISFYFSFFIFTFESKKILNTFVISVVVIFTPFLIPMTPTASDSAYIYNSIYIDWILSTILAYSLFTIYKLKKLEIFDTINIALLSTCLILAKQMGLIYFGFIVFYLIVKLIMFKNKRYFFNAILIITIPFILYYGWSYLVSLQSIDFVQFSKDTISIKTFIEVVLKKSEPYKIEAYRNFIYAVIKRPLILNPIKLSYIFSIILLVITQTLLCFKNKKFHLPIIYFITSVGYSFVMLVLYCTAFDSYEAPLLASFDRYMLSYIFVGIVLVIYLISKLKLRSQLISCLILTLFINSDSIKYTTPNITLNPVYKDKILVIYQHEESTYKTFQQVESNGFNATIDVLPYIESLTLDKLKEMVDGYDYLYVLAYDHNTYEALSTFTNDPNLLENHVFLINEDLTIEDKTYSDIWYRLRYFLLDSLK